MLLASASRYLASALHEHNARRPPSPFSLSNHSLSHFFSANLTGGIIHHTVLLMAALGASS